MILEKRLSSGKYVDLNKLTIDDINIEDIETSLNYIYRFTGHCKDNKPLTVAQHSVLTEKISEKIFPGEEETRLACVVHDFPEAYYGDITTQVKKALGYTFYEWSKPIDDLVETKFLGRLIDGELKQKVKICDLMALDIERRTMWKSQLGKDKWPTVGSINSFSLTQKMKMFEEVQSIEYVKLRNFL